MAIDLARAHLVGGVLVPMLDEVDFSRLEPAHLAEMRQLCRERIEAAASPAVTRQLGGRQGLARLGGRLGEALIEFRAFLSLLQADDVTEILVCGRDPVQVERGAGVEGTRLTFPDLGALEQLIAWLTAGCGRPTHADDPVAQARLPDGSMLSVVLPPVAVGGPVLSIRRPRHLRLDLTTLARTGIFPEPLAPLLEAMVASRLNILVSGQSGTGRTTVLNALCRAIHERERLATVEELAELQLGKACAIRLQSASDAPCTQRDLLRTALRMRPDRVVVGELLGDEAWDFLEAMGSGFQGSMATLRGSSPGEALDRLETLVGMTAGTPSELMVRRLIGRAIDLVIHLRRLADGRRVVGSIAEVVPGLGGLTIQELFRFHEQGVGTNGRVVGTFTATGIQPALSERLEQRGFRLSPELWQLQAGVT